MSQTLDEQNKPLFGGLVSTIRAASALAAQDIKFYKSLDDDLSSYADETTSRLLRLINRIVETTNEGEVEPLASADDLEDNWKSISEVLDSLFDKTDIALDEFSRGGKKASEYSKIQIGASANAKLTSLESGETGSMKDSTPVQRSQNMPKPQLKFKREIDNTGTSPFRPLITSKPNAIQPYEKAFELVQGVEDSFSHFGHPYATEIAEQAYPETIYKVSEPIPSTQWKDTKATYVDTVEKLNEMVAKLEKSREIAVDLEHHDYRTFSGLVCLMQISNRDEDWIVDTLELRTELEVLNTVFTDPKIIKVFHGAYMDIIWLQRDFGLYVVNLFDTFHASSALGLPRRSLAYLLENYANFKTSKKYQLADWRIRPLPAPMIHYARADTHFLLNIFDSLRNQLLTSENGKERMGKVLEESRITAAKRYELPGLDPLAKISGHGPDGWEKQFGRDPSRHPKRMPIIKALFSWRDSVARREDESVRYIMPEHILQGLAVLAPTDAAGVLSVSNSIPLYVRANAKTIAKVIKKAKELIDDSRSDDTNEQFRLSPVVDDFDNAANAERSTNGSSNQSEETTLESSKLFQIAFASQRDLVTHSISEPSFELDSVSLLWGSSDNKTKLSWKVDSPEFINRQTVLKDQLVLTVPVPPLNADGTVMDVDSPEEETKTVNVPEHEYVEPKGETKIKSNSDVIIVKTLGKNNNSSTTKRKIDEAADVIDLDAEEEDEDAFETTSNSQRKRAAKKAKAEETIEEEFKAFDYTAAGSVLSSGMSKAEQRKAKKDKKKERKAFNPYGESEEGPKGAKKVFRPHGGRTMTFKNKR